MHPSIPALPESVHLGEATVKQMSRALLDAYDRMDERAFAAAAGSTFGLFENGELKGRETLLKEIRERIERHAAPRSRTWKDELVSVGNVAAVFIGRAVDHFPPDGQRPHGDFEGWNTLVWVREEGRWQAVHWQWRTAGTAERREDWNYTYRTGAGRDFTTAPNRLLVETVRGRKPGTALDVGMGQGRNAIYLASQGWKVTGIDISDEGLRIARENARKQSVELEAIEADLMQWSYGTAKWDLAMLIYAGADDAVLEKIKIGLRKHGIIVIEAFHQDAQGRAYGSAEAGDLAARFKDGFKVLRNEVVDDVADWGSHRTKLLRFVAEKL